MEENHPPKRGAPRGNKNGIKLKDPHIRQLAYSSYCDHVALGKPKKVWRFRHGKFTCCLVTMEKYLKDTIEFDPIHTQVAIAQGFEVWEDIVTNCALGKIKWPSSSLQAIMRNKYGWR